MIAKKLMVGAVVAAGIAVSSAKSARAVDQAEWEKTPLVAGIIAKVPALKHPFPKNWEITHYWEQMPLSFNNPVKLKDELQGLVDRGLLPCIQVSGEYSAKPAEVSNSVAQAKAVADAGFPVHLIMGWALNLDEMPDGKLVSHADSPDSAKGVGSACCCLPLKDGWKARAKKLDEVFKHFTDAKVPVAGVWYDYEGEPYPWNGEFEHSQKCPSCRKEIPAGVLADRGCFVAWCEDLWKEAVAEAFAQPVRKAFPAAKTGFYDFVPSSEEHPSMIGHLGFRYPASKNNPPEIDISMPVLYAWKDSALRLFNADWPVGRQEMDAVYMATLLRGISNIHWNLRPNQTIMPWVSSLVPFLGATHREDVPRMSKPLYREFLRHAILRGARGFYCYNVAPPFGAMPDYYEELADINVVYNEMFAPKYRDFLEGGAVMNDQWPDPKDSNAVVWSGLAKGDQALLRVMTLGVAAKKVDLVPFAGGKAVHLTALPDGASYRVSRSGKAVRLDEHRDEK